MRPLTTIERHPKAPPTHLFIWLHGLGADGNDFVPMIEELRLDDIMTLRAVFPEAPVRSVTINQGMHMRAWYDIVGTTIQARIDKAGIEESQEALAALIHKELTAHSIPSHRVILGGFSQGAVMALVTGLAYPETLGGIVALSGYLPATENELSSIIAPQNRATPLFIAHGTADPIVPYPLGLDMAEILMRANLPVSWHSYFMPHSVCDEEVRDLRVWLLKNCV